jgi:hypothetical protein
VHGRSIQTQIVISLLLTLAGNALAEVIYVDADRGGWKTAYSTLHDALKAAKKGDEIWVANGTYKTNSSSFQVVEVFSLMTQRPNLVKLFRESRHVTLWITLQPITAAPSQITTNARQLSN